MLLDIIYIEAFGAFLLVVKVYAVPTACPF